MLRRAPRIWIALGGLAGVAAAAAAAHGAPAAAIPVETAARMLLVHALALIAVAWLADRRGGFLPAVAGLAFAIGILLFCGSLAARGFALPVPAELGRLAPAGGIALILGWLLVALAAMLGRR
jgi:uncharacterized membrane protein YgdD (TMEM256/DUF423 family)